MDVVFKVVPLVAAWLIGCGSEPMQMSAPQTKTPAAATAAPGMTAASPGAAGRPGAMTGAAGASAAAGRGTSSMPAAAGSGTPAAASGAAGMVAGGAGRGAAGGPAGAAGSAGMASAAAGGGATAGGAAAAGSGATGAAGGGAAAGATFTQVYSVLMAGCTCHATLGSGGLNTGTKAAAYMNLVGATSMKCATEKRVVAGDPTKSVLFHAVSGTTFGSCMAPSMPPVGGGAKLQAADIEKIKSWIMAGAQNN